MTFVIQWLLRGNNGIVVLGLICAVVGTCYSAPDLFGRRARFLGELTQWLIMGTVGGLALGGGITLTIVPLALLFRKSLYTSKMPGNDVFAFAHAILASAPLPLLFSIIKLAFIYSVIIGVIMGCSLGIVNSFLSFLTPPSRSKIPPVVGSISQVPRSKDMLIGWVIIGFGFGIGLWMIFGNVLGIFMGLLIGWISFLLGLHPKPVPLQNPSTRDILVRLGRLIGFWILCVGLVAIVLWRLFLYYILPEPVLGVFLLLVLLLFFGYLFFELGGLERRKTKIRVGSGQKNPGEAMLALDRLKIFRTIRMGIVCGLLLYGGCYGIPIAFVFKKFIGVGAAWIALAVFCLLGLGYGAACGIIFCYIYNFRLFVMLKISSLSEKTLRFAGLILTVIGIFISILPSLAW